MPTSTAKKSPKFISNNNAMTVKEKIIASLGAFAVKVRYAETNEQVLKLVDRTALELGKVLVKDQNHDPTTN